MLTPDEIKAIDELFTYHAPTPEQVKRLALLRVAGHGLAYVIVESCPPSADRSAALRKLREAVMTANASIVLPALPAL